MSDAKDVRIVIEVPPEYKRAVKMLAASEDSTIKTLIMEAIEKVCKDRKQEHLIHK